MNVLKKSGWIQQGLSLSLSVSLCLCLSLSLCLCLSLSLSLSLSFSFSVCVYKAKNLKKRIAKELKEFTECIESYQDERDSKLRAVYWNDIKEMLNRESNFAGFKRSIVLQSKELMQCFGELMN